MQRNLERVGGFTYTAGGAEVRRGGSEDADRGADDRARSQEKVQPMRLGVVGSASTDLADVSWNVPTAQVVAATFVPGVPAHSWQATACAGGTIGAQRHDGRGEDDGADHGRSLQRSNAYPEGEGGIRQEARTRVRLQDAARRPEAGARLSEVGVLEVTAGDES